MKKLTYQSAGVDLKKADRFIEKIKPIVAGTGVSKGIGGFGGFFSFDARNYRRPVLVSSTDGVGTKLKIAFLAGRHDTVGIDLVGMNANDVLCSGARPLFFLDYIAAGKIGTQVLVDVVRGIAEGCRQAGCGLIGGETAQMSAFYKAGEYDLAGFCVGVTEEDAIIDGTRTETGDAIIGLASNGLHSNGYSLVRKVFSQRELKRLSSELLKPTRIYVKPVLKLLERPGGQDAVKGIAHITGGAFYGKIPRIIPKNKAFEICKGLWPVPDIFRLIQRKGNISEREMYRCFNMGLGMILAVKRGFVQTAIGTLAGQGVRSWLIGEVVKGKGELRLD